MTKQMFTAKLVILGYKLNIYPFMPTYYRKNSMYIYIYKSNNIRIILDPKKKEILTFRSYIKTLKYLTND